MSEILVRAAAVLIDAASAAVVAFFAVRALLAIARRDADRARLPDGGWCHHGSRLQRRCGPAQDNRARDMAPDRDVWLHPRFPDRNEMGICSRAPDAGAVRRLVSNGKAALF